MIDRGGLTNVGYRLWLEDPGARVGTMVAGNSGRPGGACGQADGTVRHLHAGHSTQEEDVLSNWLLTAAGNAHHEEEGGAARAGGLGPSAGAGHSAGPVGAADPSARAARYASELYSRTIHRVWGMVDPEGSDAYTVQRVNYKKAGEGHWYADAWVVDDVRLSCKLPANSARGGGGTAACFDTSMQYPSSLVFVAGPNAGAYGTSAVSTMRRTFNKRAAEDYQLFRAGVKSAVQAGLLAMAHRGCTVALLAFVSGGLYAGKWRAGFRDDFVALVNELLTSPYELEPPLAQHFERVVLTLLDGEAPEGAVAVGPASAAAVPPEASPMDVDHPDA